MVRYTCCLTVDRAVPEDDFTPAEHERAMGSRGTQRDLEREVLHCLRPVDGDCDCDVLTVLGMEKP